MNSSYDSKLWGGRFRSKEDELMEKFQNGFKNTLWLLEPDLIGSIAHVSMLIKSNILKQNEGEKIIDGLNSILEDYKNSNLDLDGEYEDVHTFTELELIKRIGDLGKKVHTARSRNDQCNVDMKIFVKKEIKNIISLIDSFLLTLKNKAEENPHIMPGYTHLQRAQVVTFKHHLLAYYNMLKRDKKRLTTSLETISESPLGCGALAGTTHSIDRKFTAELLGFESVYDNFIDGISDRDFV